MNFFYFRLKMNKLVTGPRPNSVKIQELCNDLLSELNPTSKYCQYIYVLEGTLHCGNPQQATTLTSWTAWNQ